MSDFFCHTVILLVLLKVSTPQSMVVVSGKPSSFKSSETVAESWESCLAGCIDDDQCIAIISESECPATNPVLSGSAYSFENSDGTLYKTTVSIDSSQNYNLNYSIITCPNNTKLFQRANVIVCIGLFMFDSPLCNTFQQGSALCKAANGTLTGPANSIEYEYIQAQSKISHNTSNPSGYGYLVYWIDGVGTSTKYVYTFEDPTHNGVTNYQWAAQAPGFTGTKYCLCNPNPLGLYIADNLCSETEFGTVCWRGALCQVPYSFESN